MCRFVKMNRDPSERRERNQSADLGSDDSMRKLVVYLASPRRR